jgi:SAM-dependent methyltransferase
MEPLSSSGGASGAGEALPAGLYARSAPLYDLFYSYKDYAAEAALLHGLIQRLRPGARSLLDVACGTAKHLRWLARDYEVEGLDLSAEMLECARRRCPGISFHQGDMHTFQMGRTYDAVLCLFSSIGYARTYDGLCRAVANMARHVSPGGMLGVEAWIAPEKWQCGNHDLLTAERPGLKAARMMYSQRDGDVSVIQVAFLVGTPRGLEYYGERHEMGLWTAEQYEAALRAAGLRPQLEPRGLTGRGLWVGLAP